MYLINVRTKELEDFIQSEVPPYAILSHRWGSPAEELNFKEVFKKRIDPRIEGYFKLTEACRIAAEYEVNYLWNDTCCIDKKSSAELSEAINSMYSWYSGAKICLAYLNDVRAGENLDEDFIGSVWFTRAWTLQELIAPKELAFFDCNWQYIGTKNSRAPIIKSVTGIPDKVLRDPSTLSSVNIRDKMSWASNRNATRPEDIAYSLMGIFDINMPLLYGEGTTAFTRLQEEIIRRATEPSFLLWRHSIKSTTPKNETDLLARSPADFQRSQVEACSDDDSNGDRFQNNFMTPVYDYLKGGRNTLGLTNIGLEIDAMLIRPKLGTYGVILGVASSSARTVDVMLLKRRRGRAEFYRIDACQTIQYHRVSTKCEYKKITILRNYNNRLQESPDIEYGFHIRACASFLMSPIKSWLGRDPTIIWRKGTGSTGLTCTFTEPLREQVASIARKINDSCTLVLHLSFDFDSRPCLLIMNSVDPKKLRGQSYGKFSVFEISDSVGKPLRTLSYEYTYYWSPEVALHEVLENPRPVFYFLRSDGQGGGVAARLPCELVGTEDTVWVSFIAPGVSCRPWLFAITRSQPGIFVLPEHIAESELEILSSENYFQSDEVLPASKNSMTSSSSASRKPPTMQSWWRLRSRRVPQ